MLPASGAYDGAKKKRRRIRVLNRLTAAGVLGRDNATRFTLEKSGSG